MKAPVGDFLVVGIMVVLSVLFGVLALRWQFTKGEGFLYEKLRTLAWSMIIIPPLFYLWWFITALSGGTFKTQ